MKARLASLILLLLLAAKLNAGIINGDFSIAGVSPDPFANWTTDVSFFEPPSGTGFAQFDTDDINFQSIHLAQTFSLDAGSTTLSFEFKITFAIPTGGVPDSFQVTLFDNSITPVELFPENPPTFTSFYRIDNDGVSEFFDSNFVMSDFDALSGVRTIKLNISTLTPQILTLDFLLNGSVDGQSTQVQLDNVMILSSPTVVPEPTSLLVWSACIGLCIFSRSYRRG